MDAWKLRITSPEECLGHPRREGRSTMLSRGLQVKERRNQAKRTNEIEHQRVPHKSLALTQSERRWSCTLRDVKHQNIVIPQTSTDLEIQGVSIFWGEHKLNIFKMYHPPNQGCLPDSFLDLATANVSSIFIGVLNASITSWGCSVNNSRGCDLLNAADDRALIFLSDGSPTHHSFSYNTAEALDIALARRGCFSFLPLVRLGQHRK
ncbi:hypothetical protein TNCV_1135171 [Trichonephila clavipes]|nr:hypothetical protein TNCV_1135171 [Trichonephila clavipes]